MGRTIGKRIIGGLLLAAAWAAVVAAPCAALAQDAASPGSAATQPTTRPATSRPADSIARTERATRISKAIEVLVQEAQSLDDFKNENPRLTFSRPHPVLSTWGPDMAIDTLDRMIQNFTGNEFRDTYIRWHLMAVVKKAAPADRRATGSRLVQLIKMMPGPLAAAGRPDHHYEPPEIASKYFSLANSGLRTVGYPPFQRQVGPPESYKYMDAATAAKTQANLEEAAKLRDKFHIVIDKAAQAWNSRIGAVNYYIREYRGELIYALLLTGDPNIAKLVMNEIDRQVKGKSGIGFDLLAYVYLAAFDKALNAYDQPTLNEMSNILEGTARAADEYVSYGGQTRNFAQYSFHLIYMLKDGGGFIDAKAADEPKASRFRH
ncbi:MAG: hypothetical protein NTW19_11805 [Planctomycetota bacterium]|nr:hypothetical protein [Planctomycetota bacterium]